MHAVEKVLLIGPACDGEDVGEAWLAHQWTRLLGERFEVTLLSTYKRGHRPPSEQLPGVRTIEWHEPAGVGRFERLNSLMQPGYVPFYRRARRWIRDRLEAGETFDVAHQVVPAALRYPSPAAALGIPLVIGPVGGSLDSPAAFVAEEGGTPWYQRMRSLDRLRLTRDPLLRKSFESADVVLGNGAYVAELLAPIDIRRFEVMSDVALHAVQPAIDRGGRSGPVRLLHVGRLVRTKGLRDLIRALALTRDLDVTLDVLGEGNDREACLELAAELGVADRVRLHGNVARATVDDFYRAADIFVFPSYREPGGSVVLEAMSFGLPLIVCDRGGPASNVVDSCAIRLPVSTPAALAADCATAIRDLVEDPERRIRMGSASLTHAGSSHLWPDRIDRVSAIYRSLG